MTTFKDFSRCNQNYLQNGDQRVASIHLCLGFSFLRSLRRLVGFPSLRQQGCVKSNSLLFIRTGRKKTVWWGFRTASFHLTHSGARGYSLAVLTTPTSSRD